MLGVGFVAGCCGASLAAAVIRTIVRGGRRKTVGGPGVGGWVL
jgi:hypothetical protein